jgi:hypothetical protein
LIDSFLTFQAVRRPWNRFQPFFRNLFTAAQTHAENLIIEATQGRLHTFEKVRFPVQIANGNVSGQLLLQPVEVIGGRLYENLLTVRTLAEEFPPFQFQGTPENVLISFAHVVLVPKAER